jgi:hypothetical protein
MGLEPRWLPSAVQVSAVKKNGDLSVDVLNIGLHPINIESIQVEFSAASALSDLASMIGQLKKKEQSRSPLDFAPSKPVSNPQENASLFSHLAREVMQRFCSRPHCFPIV